MSNEELQRTYEGGFLCHCSVAPVHPIAQDAEREFSKLLYEQGVRVYSSFPEHEIADRFHAAFGKLLETDPANISVVTNTAIATSSIASGYPWEKGDRIITYEREYGSLYFPWLNAARRYGLQVDLLPDIDPIGGLPAGSARGWSFDDLERLIGERTRIVALSHVQFISGFAADLERVGALCKERGVDLVIDAAQSLGCLPIYPDRWNISAVAASGWKWLMGHPSVAMFYSSPEFRYKLEHTLVGPLMMENYLEFENNEWRPTRDGRRFEFSTYPFSYAHALAHLVETLFLPLGSEAIKRKVFALQDEFLGILDRDKYTPLLFPEANRSGILALLPRQDSKRINAMAGQRGLHLISYEPYLRIGAHFINSSDEVRAAAELLNELG